MPILFVLILVGLANIQDHLENPFDQIGQDDVAIHPDRFIETLDVAVTGAAAAAKGRTHGERPTSTIPRYRRRRHALVAAADPRLDRQAGRRLLR